MRTETQIKLATLESQSLETSSTYGLESDSESSIRASIDIRPGYADRRNLKMDIAFSGPDTLEPRPASSLSTASRPPIRSPVTERVPETGPRVVQRTATSPPRTQPRLRNFTPGSLFGHKKSETTDGNDLRGRGVAPVRVSTGPPFDTIGKPTVNFFQHAIASFNTQPQPDQSKPSLLTSITRRLSGSRKKSHQGIQRDDSLSTLIATSPTSPTSPTDQSREIEDLRARIAELEHSLAAERVRSEDMSTRLEAALSEASESKRAVSNVEKIARARKTHAMELEHELRVALSVAGTLERQLLLYVNGISPNVAQLEAELKLSLQQEVALEASIDSCCS
ncbi:hypothetical protein HDU93_006016 [Gonapodya sp. JEL0774]|nr:hypothetical protein HDU93_006016 [Gonapodya sp. JEL0774]